MVLFGVIEDLRGFQGHLHKKRATLQNLFTGHQRYDFVVSSMSFCRKESLSFLTGIDKRHMFNKNIKYMLF